MTIKTIINEMYEKELDDSYRIMNNHKPTKIYNRPQGKNDAVIGIFSNGEDANKAHKNLVQHLQSLGHEYDDISASGGDTGIVNSKHPIAKSGYGESHLFKKDGKPSVNVHKSISGDDDSESKVEIVKSYPVFESTIDNKNINNIVKLALEGNIQEATAILASLLDERKKEFVENAEKFIAASVLECDCQAKQLDNEDEDFGEENEFTPPISAPSNIDDNPIKTINPV